MEEKKILDIFSNERIKKEEKSKILIDYREKNCLVPFELKNRNLNIEFCELKVGDYLVNNVIIERKTVNDFISSMINKRILRQIESLNQYEDKLLIIEGMEERELYNENNKNINSNAIRGFLLSILLNYKIPVLFTKNAEDTARFIEVLTKKKKTEHSLNFKRKGLTKEEQIEFILESFPAIGPKTSKKLLKEFKSLNKIFNSSQEELRKVIGKKAEVFDLINEDYRV